MKRKYLYFFTVMCMVIVLLPANIITVSAYSGTKYGDYLYYKVSNGEITITDCVEAATEIVIPSEIDGKPVTNIGNYAFSFCSSLTNITIPDSVTSIGEYSFSNCSLTSITIPDKVTSIGEGAFNECRSLTSVTIPDSVTSIGNWVFAYCYHLTSIDVDVNNNYYSSLNGNLYNKDKTTLIQYAIGKSESSFFIPDSVTSIGDYAFSNCNSLTNITIPNSVTSLDRSAFSACNSLTSIDVDVNNNYYSSLNGNLYNKDKTTFILYAKGKSESSFSIPNSVTSIGEYSFFNCSLTSITIPDGVTSIGDNAFSGCHRLTSITIPNSITIISEDSFSYCSKLSEVYYDGTEQTWNNIQIGSGNEQLTSARRKYFRYVTLVGEDGKEISRKKYDVGSAFDLSENEKAGYSIHLYTDEACQNEFDKDMPITENTKLWLIYVVNQYTYKFVDEDGTILKEATVDYGEKIVPPENPSKESTAQFTYTFSGWDGYSEGMTQTAEELVFYATYSVKTNKYTYKFVDEDGTVLKEKTVNYNTMITAPTAPTKAATAQYTYTFEKWDGFTVGMKATQDITFKAIYSASVNKYTYKFLNEDGSVIEEKTVEYGTEIVAPDIILTKSSTDKYTYTHTGWNGYTSGMTVSENISFTPIFDYTVNKYSYKFVDEDGTVLKEDTVDYDAVITPPQNPEKAATKQYTYAFEGWGGYSEGITQTAETMVFTAKYSRTVNQYTYKFVDDNGTVLKELTADYGTVIEAPENPTKAATAKYSYTFSKWVGFADRIVLTDDITFTAEYSAEINKYTYKFIDHDGTIIKSGTIDYGTVIPVPSAPESFSDQQYTYVFASWNGYIKGTKITKDVEYTARYSSILNQYTYLFVDENGNTVAEETADYGTVIETPEAPLKPSNDKYSYVFAGWDGYTDGMVLKDDIIFKPNYTAVINQYTYRFVDEDGTVLMEDTVDYDTVITAPKSPSKAATKQYTYTFEGWDGYSEGMTQTAETMVFTAKYSKSVNQYTYKFVDEDGTVLKEATVDYGTIIDLPDDPSKAANVQYSYVFSGWEGYVDGMSISDDITFTATYSPVINQYTYKFIDNDGTVLKESTVDYGTTVTAPETPADKDPYTFDYWNNYTENMVVDGDVTFTAVYKYKQYTITIDELGKTQVVTYNDGYTLPIQEVKDFVFKGYYTKPNGEGTKLTDEQGNSIIGYSFAENITLYPYYVHSFANRVVITGSESAQLGDENILQTVAFATDKQAKYLTCTVKYPSSFNLNTKTKDFVLANINSVETKDGYNYAYLKCMYDYAENTIPTNQTVVPFELLFSISKASSIGDASIEIYDISLIGDESYSIEETAKTITVLPKLAEKIEIVGADTIDKATDFTAIVTPDYTTNKAVVWSVDNESIATISQDGTLIPIKNGVVTLKATATDGSGVLATKEVNIIAYAKINTLSIAGVWDKEFSPDVYEYTVYVRDNVDSISIKANYTAGTLFANNDVLLPNMENRFILNDNSEIITLSRSNVADMTDSEYKITVIKFEGTKTTVSEDGKTFTVKPINIEKGNAIILALYDGDKFIGMQSAEFDGADLTFMTDTTYTGAKVMVWSDLTSLKPMCGVETVK